MTSVFYRGLRRFVSRMVDGPREYARLQAAMTDLLLTACRDRKIERLLDVGCGAGGYTQRNAEALGVPLESVSGVDTNPEHVESAEGTFEIRALDLESEALPFESGSFDLVVCNQVLEHLKNIFWVLGEMDRVTRVGGILAVGVPNLTSLLNRPFLALGHQPVTIGIEGPHVRGFTLHAFRRFLVSHPGFRVKRAIGSSLYPWPAKLGAEYLARRAPGLSAYFFLALEKISSVSPSPWLDFGMDGETSYVHWRRSLEVGPDG